MIKNQKSYLNNEKHKYSCKTRNIQKFKNKRKLSKIMETRKNDQK